MTNTRQKGDDAEKIAVEYLEQNGYVILEQNWYNHHHELDIIARKNGIVAIIEVKSLASTTFREPYQQVNIQKQRSIISATNAYIRQHNINDDVRFDIVSIVMGKTPPLIDHIENAFYPKVR